MFGQRLELECGYILWKGMPLESGQRNGASGHYFLSITATTEQSRGIPIMAIAILDLGSW